jgi:hypothetical protein
MTKTYSSEICTNQNSSSSVPITHNNHEDQIECTCLNGQIPLIKLNVHVLTTKYLFPAHWPLPPYEKVDHTQ